MDDAVRHTPANDVQPQAMLQGFPQYGGVRNDAPGGDRAAALRVVEFSGFPPTRTPTSPAA